MFKSRLNQQNESDLHTGCYIYIYRDEKQQKLFWYQLLNHINVYFIIFEETSDSSAPSHTEQQN